MSTLQNKIDFAVAFRVKRANPNGDPLNGNRPRTDYDNYGEMTDVCNKRKIRDRLLEKWVAGGKKKDDGNEIFVQSDDRKEDECKSLRARAEAGLGNKLGSDETVDLACKKWLDVRAFGQLFALKGGKKARKARENEGEGDTGISMSVSRPSYRAIRVQCGACRHRQHPDNQECERRSTKDGKRSSDTMGMKHRVDNGGLCFSGA